MMNNNNLSFFDKSIILFYYSSILCNLDNCNDKIIYCHYKKITLFTHLDILHSMVVFYRYND